MSKNPIPTLRVKIADTPEAQAQGLMFVRNMPSDAGMLFVFGRTQNLSFWGENTLIPLDIAFADSNGVIVKIDRIAPLSRKSVSSEKPCKYAVEANVGYFESNHVKIGDIITINKERGAAVIAFSRKSKLKTSQILPDDIADRFSNLGDYYDYYDSQQQQQQQGNQLVEDSNLPVLSPEDLGQYMEDSIEDQQDMQQEDGLPQEEPPSPEELMEKPVEELEQEIPTFTNISDAFDWGQQNKQVLKISYQTKPKTKGTRMFGNRLITRYVEPHGKFTSSPENEPSHEILVTFDETVGGIRAFRMQNVREFSFIGRQFKPKFIVR